MNVGGVDIEVSLVSAGFIGGLVVMTLARVVTPRSWHTAIGVVAGAALIGLGSPATLAMLAGTTLGVVYPLSRVIAAKRESSPGVARAALLAGIAVIVTAWVLFKANRQTELSWLFGSRLSAELVTLVGFSYFVFRAINVLHMHFLLGEVPGSSPLRMLYHAIFPATVTSGPIHKYVDFCREAASPRPLDVACVVTAAERITRGYFYKVCIVPVVEAGANGLLAHGAFNGYCASGSSGGRRPSREIMSQGRGPRGGDRRRRVLMLTTLWPRPCSAPWTIPCPCGTRRTGN